MCEGYPHEGPQQPLSATLDNVLRWWFAIEADVLK